MSGFGEKLEDFRVSDESFRASGVAFQILLEAVPHTWKDVEVDLAGCASPLALQHPRPALKPFEPEQPQKPPQIL